MNDISLFLVNYDHHVICNL